MVLHRNLFACVYVNALLFSLWEFDWGDEKRIGFIAFELDKVVDFMPTYLQGAMEKSEST